MDRCADSVFPYGAFDRDRGETDPRFADYRDWLSTDDLLKQIAVDPATTKKRLGDGLYEQRLVREQIFQFD